MKKLFMFAIILSLVLIIIIAVLSSGESAIVYTRPYSYDSDYLKEIRQYEDDILSTYKLIDSTNQTYSIPIDSAISIFVDERN